MTTRYVGGYGRAKHVLDPQHPHTDAINDGYGYCGAYGGYPRTVDECSVCKRCASMATKAGVIL